ncbi:Uncharacterised protein [uncultured archaeon]|nr:Uncharacterised protein [uncultured archaeon]
MDAVCNFLRRLGLDANIVVRAVGNADPRKEQPQVVVDRSYRADGAARVLGGSLLLDGYGGGEPLDAVHIRLIHLAQELAGVGGERFDIAALALGVNGVKGQGGFA